MRSVLLVVVVVAACGNDPPSDCVCVLDGPPAQDFCCGGDLVFCWPDSKGHWEEEFCDGPFQSDAGVDAAPEDPCTTCAPQEICVQRFDGLCNHHDTVCVPRVVDCPQNVCSPACEAAYCPAPFQCANRITCGTESPLAFTCYGP
jgi:hypothetical protein